MAKVLRVGIVGASATGGWARASHAAALQRLAGLELAAIATSKQQSADAAAAAFGAKSAYGNAAALFADREIDIVAVCVRPRDHREMVLGALAARKHVYCEWPLGLNVAENQEMAAAANAAGVHAAVGLQTRMNAAALRARELLRSGAIGRLLSARIYSATAGFGSNVPPDLMYAEDGENGVTLPNVQGAHTLDFAIAVLGAFDDASALLTRQYPEVNAADDATRRKRTTFDHVLVQSRLHGGGALALEVAGGRPAETPFRLEALGERGVLALDGGAMRGFQAGRLRLSLGGAPQPVDDGEAAALPDEAANVGAMYVALRDDIEAGTATVPDFEHAVRLARLIEDVTSSSETGMRKQAADWPVR